MTAPVTLEQLHPLLRSRSARRFQEGLDQIPSLGAEDLTALIRGLQIDDGSFRLSGATGRCWIRTHVPNKQRGDVALVAARAAGLLDAVTHINLRSLPGYSSLAPLAGLRQVTRLQVGVDLQAWDLSPLAGLTGLEDLSLDGAYPLEDLSPLAGLTGLRRLKISTGGLLKDLSPLAGLAALTELSLSDARAIHDLSPLAGLGALESLSLGGCAAVSDLSPLAGLSSLRSLHVFKCGTISDLSPLAGLAALEDLRLWRVGADLSPLAGLVGLRSLDLRGNVGLDLSPLTGLSGLRALVLSGCQDLRGGEALAGLAGLAEAFSVDDAGAVLHEGRAARPDALFVLLQVDGPHMEQIQTLSLQGCSLLNDLDRISRMPALTRLTLNGCVGLEDVWPLIRMEGLQVLDLGGGVRARPRPARMLMDEPEEIQSFRRKIARALKQKKDRTPEEEDLLQEARDLGLLERHQASEEERERADLLKRIRRFIAAPDLDVASQGYDLLEALDDEALIADLARGVTLDARGQVVLSESAQRRSHLRRTKRRTWAGLSLLRLSGALEGVTTLQLASYQNELEDLSPLSALEALETLRLRVTQIEDLSPLEPLSNLKSLSLESGWRLSDLSPLASLSSLEDLALNGCRHVSDLGPLAGLTGLRSLSVIWSYGVHDLSPLSGLTRLESLTLSGCGNLRDLSPLSGLAGLRELTIASSYHMPAAALGALAGLGGLERLLLNRCAAFPAALQKEHVGREAVQAAIQRAVDYVPGSGAS